MANVNVFDSFILLCYYISNIIFNGGLLWKRKKKNLKLLKATDLGINMSPVLDYITSIKPTDGKKKKLIVPTEKKFKDKNKKKK